jgi:hypothetical protein
LHRRTRPGPPVRLRRAFGYTLIVRRHRRRFLKRGQAVRLRPAVLEPLPVGQTRREQNERSPVRARRKDWPHLQRRKRRQVHPRLTARLECWPPGIEVADHQDQTVCAPRSGCLDAIRTRNPRERRCRTMRRPRKPVPPNTVTVRPFVAMMIQIHQFTSSHCLKSRDLSRRSINHSP